MNAVSSVLRNVRRLVISGLRPASYFFLVLGVLAVGYAGYVFADAETYQAIEIRKFNLKPPLAEPHLPTIGEVIGEIQIPRLGISAIVAEGDSAGVLRRAVGHIPETALPGESGNVALAGHRDRLFRALRQIRRGDSITIQTPGESYHYQVESTFVVPPTETEVLRFSNEHELTLITCFPFDFVGSAPNRFIVRAREVAPTEK